MRRVASASGRIDEGEVIGGRYRVTGVLGQGGFGTVYDAMHVTTGHPVAVKVLSDRPDASDDELQRRFFQEAATTSRLSHPNTVRVFDFGETDGGQLFLAMERLVGETLQDLFMHNAREGTAMPDVQAANVGIAVLRSLGEAHAHGLVHRDLKPANIFLHEVAGGDRIVKVLDFGIVKDIDASMTQAGKALGTPTHMSPEQAMGTPVDARTDLYALGVCLYEAVTGTLPFSGDNPLTIVMQHVTDPITPIEERAPGKVRPAIAHVIERSLAKMPDERWDDAQQMREALQRGIDLQPSGVYEVLNPRSRRSEKVTSPPLSSGKGSWRERKAGAGVVKQRGTAHPHTQAVSSMADAPKPAPSKPPGRSDVVVRTGQQRVVGMDSGERTAIGTSAMLDDVASEQVRRGVDAPTQMLDAEQLHELTDSAILEIGHPAQDLDPPPPVAPPPPVSRPSERVRVTGHDIGEDARTVERAPATVDDGLDAATMIAGEPAMVSAMRRDGRLADAPPIITDADDTSAPSAPTAAKPTTDPYIARQRATPDKPSGPPRDESSARYSGGWNGEPEDAESADTGLVDADTADPDDNEPAAAMDSSVVTIGGVIGSEADVMEVDDDEGPVVHVEIERRINRGVDDRLGGFAQRRVGAAAAELLAAASMLGGGRRSAPDANPFSGAPLGARLSADLARMTQNLRRRNSSGRTAAARNSVSAMFISDDASSLVYGNAAGDVRLVRSLTFGEQAAPLSMWSDEIEVGEHGGLVSAVAATPDGRTVVTADSNGEVRAWSPADGTVVADLDLHSGVTSMAMCSDGRLCIIGCRNGSAHLVKLPSLEVRRTLSAHQGAVTAAAAASSRRVIATAGEDGAVRTWDPVGGGGRLTKRYHDGAIGALALSRNRKFIVSGGWDGKVVVWAAANGHIELKLDAHDDIVSGVAIDNDCEHIATVSDDKRARVWNIESGDIVCERADFHVAPKFLRFSNDGMEVYVAAWDGSIRKLPVPPS